MKRSYLSQFLMVGVSAAALWAAPISLATAQEMPGEGTTVKMGQATWDTGWFHAEIYKQLLQKLGYEVEGPTTLDNPPFYQAVSQGDLDLWVNGWFGSLRLDIDCPLRHCHCALIPVLSPKG